MPARPASRRESAPSLRVRKRSGYSCPSVENERSRSAAANRLVMPGAELQLPAPPVRPGVGPANLRAVRRPEEESMTGQGSPASSSYNAAVALEFFRSAGKPKTFAKGRKIFAENQRGFPFLLMPNRMYLLLDGEVAIFAKNTPIGTVRPGQIFGEMASIDQGPRSASAVATTTSRVIALDNRQLQRALGKKPEFALMLMSVMINRLRESIGRLGSETPLSGAKWRESAPLRKDLVDDLARLVGPGARFSYEAGKTILTEGRAGVLMYVVLRGRVAIRVGGSLVEAVGPGSVFGEMALVDRSPRLASAVAESDCELLAINRNVFLELVKHSRRFAPRASAMPCPGRSGIRKWPSLHAGISSNRSGGVQSMNSTRNPFESAPTACSESSCTTCGATATWCAPARRPMRSVSEKPLARHTSGMRYRAARRSISSRNSNRV